MPEYERLNCKCGYSFIYGGYQFWLLRDATEE